MHRPQNLILKEFFVALRSKVIKNEKTKKMRLNRIKYNKLHLLFCAFLFSLFNLYSQTTEEVKDKIVDSLLKAKVDTIFVIMTDTDGSITSDIQMSSGPQKTCPYSDTYYIFLEKEQCNKLIILNNCYKKEVTLNESQIMIPILSKDFKSISSLKNNEENNTIIINSDTIIYSFACNNSDSIVSFKDRESFRRHSYTFYESDSIVTFEEMESSDDIFQFEFFTQNRNYKSDVFHLQLFCSKQTKNIPEIIKLLEFYEKIKEFKIENYIKFSTEDRILENWYYTEP